MSQHLFQKGEERNPELLCSEPNCKAFRLKDSLAGYCKAHSKSFGERINEFQGSIIEAMENPDYFGEIFGTDQSSWRNWKVILKSIFCIPMEPEEREIYTQLTNRKTTPTEQPREVFLVVGRRGGKSFIVSLIAVYLAFFRSYKKYLQKGERGYITIIASDKSQTQIILKYIKALLSLPAFSDHIENDLKETVDLDSGVSIIVKTASISSPRGLTNIAILADECSFWKGEQSTNPDKEIYTALTPTTLTIPNALMLYISTPYARSGLMFEKYQKYFGVRDKSTLVCQAPSKTMNPTLPSTVIEEELQRDPDSGRAEYLAIFRQDISGWLSSMVIENAIIPGRGNLPPNPKFKYFGFVDGASGSGQDSFTLSIGHQEKELVIIDFVMEWRVPFSPKAVIKECSKYLKSYGISNVTGDKFSPGLLAEEFKNNGIAYEYSKLSASEIYRESAYLFNQGAVELPDFKRLENQLKSLEKRTRQGGKDLITHPPFKNSHDDISNSVCGVIVNLKMGVVTNIDDLPLPSKIGGREETMKLASRIKDEAESFRVLLRGGMLKR